tara:strand:+ start:191 stop:1702 length:1512 start_codon:yes stop_codon:yes gene_type:complete
MATYNTRTRNTNGVTALVNPMFQKQKKIKYGTSDEIYVNSTTISATEGSDVMPSKVQVTNTGRVPVVILTGYKTFSDETTQADSGNTRYVHTLLNPSETFEPPVRAVISTENASTQFAGTAVDNVAPNSNMYVDSTADVDHATANTIGSDATHTTLNLEDGHSKFFFVGDLIRIENEICEVTAVGTGADLANSTLTIVRGTHGSTAATHADDVAVRLPFFNAYHDFDKYSVAQTDSDGKFLAYNFFGYSRASSGVQGINAGSIAIKFYKSGYQELGLSGITPSTHTGLTASTAYEFDIQVDGGTNFDNLSFTTDSTNLNFGGANGVLSKIQSALDAQFYTSGNLFEKKVHVNIVNGDVRFTSGSHLSTSAIALTAGSSGTAEFFGTGRIPAVGSIDAAVSAKLPDDSVYDNITNVASASNVFAYDDGMGNIRGACSGTINYDTGKIMLQGAPVNAEFVVSVTHTSAFSGALNTDKTNRINGIVSVLANNFCQKAEAEVKVEVM